MERFLPAACDLDRLSPLDLAFLGDCVYALFVREQLVCEANRPNRDLHEAKVKTHNDKICHSSTSLMLRSE